MGLIYCGMTDVAGENKEAKSLFSFVSGLCPNYFILIKKNTPSLFFWWNFLFYKPDIAFSLWILKSLELGLTSTKYSAHYNPKMTSCDTCSVSSTNSLWNPANLLISCYVMYYLGCIIVNYLLTYMAVNSNGNLH